MSSAQFSGLFAPMPQPCPDCLLPTSPEELSLKGCCLDCWAKAILDEEELNEGKEPRFTRGDE